jgi:hypothetical protein
MNWNWQLLLVSVPEGLLLASLVASRVYHGRFVQSQYSRDNRRRENCNFATAFAIFLSLVCYAVWVFVTGQVASRTACINYLAVMAVALVFAGFMGELWGRGRFYR